MSINLISYSDCLNQLIDYNGYTIKQAEKFLFEIKDEIYVNESRIRSICYLYSPKYSTYLKSKRWEEVRTATKNYYQCCQSCGSDKNLQVHHLTYERLGRELFEDLTLLCGKCHMLKHI